MLPGPNPTTSKGKRNWALSSTWPPSRAKASREMLPWLGLPTAQSELHWRKAEPCWCNPAYLEPQKLITLPWCPGSARVGQTTAWGLQRAGSARTHPQTTRTHLSTKGVVDPPYMAAAQDYQLPLLLASMLAANSSLSLSQPSTGCTVTILEKPNSNSPLSSEQLI